MSHFAERDISHDANGNGNGHGAAVATDRRRSEKRTTCDRPISLMPLAGEGGQFDAAQLTDCSPHGLGLILAGEVKAGQQVLVRLKVNKLVLLVYTIRYCIP